MKMPLLFVVVAMLLLSAGCGKKETAGDGDQTGPPAGQADPILVRDKRPQEFTGPGVAPSPAADEPRFDLAPAVPPVPRNRFVDSLGRALIEGTKKTLQPQTDP